MPHLFTNRQRQHNLISGHTANSNQFQWEAINATIYLLGGLIFIIGSILFLPVYAKYSNWGVLIFIIGSLLYLFVTGHDLLEVVNYRRTQTKLSLWDQLELSTAVSYLIGTIAFIVGSIFFLSQIGLTAAGSYCFIIGSILFFVGSCINAMQIVRAGSKTTLQLMNATAITFIVGSTIFVFGSIPYLWDHLTEAAYAIESVHLHQMKADSRSEATKAFLYYDLLGVDLVKLSFVFRRLSPLSSRR